MSIAISNSPMRVLIGGSPPGPPGAGIASAALNSAGQLVLTCTDGTQLAAIDLSTAVEQAAIAGSSLGTVDGDTLTTADGRPLTRIV